MCLNYHFILVPASESRLTASQRVSEFTSETCTCSGRRLQKTPLYISNSERKQTDRSEESKRVYERNVYVVKLTPACESRMTVSQRVSEFTGEACTWSGRRLQKSPLHIGNSERKQTDRSEESKRVYERNVICAAARSAVTRALLCRLYLLRT